jgi:hypothetical protein
MAKRFSSWLYRVSTGWVALAALLIFLVFSALVLPRQASRAEQETGDAPSPDMSFYYSAGDLYDMAEAYGESGRAAYVRARFTFDLVWPLVYALFLTTAVSWIYDRALPAGSAWRLVNLLPLVAALFDYLENIATSLVMLRFPEPTAVVDVLAPVFTMVKWSLLGISFVLLFGGCIVAVWRRARADRAS